MARRIIKVLFSFTLAIAIYIILKPEGWLEYLGMLMVCLATGAAIGAAIGLTTAWKELHRKDLS